MERLSVLERCPHGEVRLEKYNKVNRFRLGN